MKEQTDHTVTTYNVVVPTHFVSAIVNHDRSGLTDDEELMLDAWLNSLPLDCYIGLPMAGEDDSFFSWRNDITGNEGCTAMHLHVHILN